MLHAQPAVVRVRSPCKVLGDVHGQLGDLLLLLHTYGFPSNNGPGGDIEVTSYIFNGDFIDRGPHQLETLVVLMALKVAYPSRIWLLRGNHECRSQNKITSQSGGLGFDRACVLSLGGAAAAGMEAFDACHAALDWLPTAAILDGSILVLHGGLGDAAWTLEQLEREAEAARPFGDGAALADCLLQAMWSDPVEDDGSPSGLPGHGPRPDATGRLKQFGPAQTAAFCAREGLSLVVRSHQCVPGGFRVLHGGRLVTVFSARDYGQDYGRRQGDDASCAGSPQRANEGALLLFAVDDEGNLRMRTKVLASAKSHVESNHHP